MYNLVHCKYKKWAGYVLDIRSLSKRIDGCSWNDHALPQKTSQQTTVIDAQCTKRSSIDIKIEVKEG